jgi:hypothetical protein
MPKLAALAAAGLALSGCSEAVLTSNIRDTMPLAAGQAIATNADVRLVHRFQGFERHKDGKPDTECQYLCAEPSPDIARAVQAANSLSGSADANVKPGGAGTTVDAKLAAQLAFSRSESVAALTKRIASIQLMRDAMYRACEAYANGAIGREMYAAIISRYDRAMITMLMGEMAVGNFGTAITLSGTATTDSAATTDGKSATGKATATGNASAPDTNAKAAADIAEVLAGMHKEYLSLPHADSFVLMCMAEAADPEKMGRVESAMCQRAMALFATQQSGRR